VTGNKQDRVKKEQTAMATFKDHSFLSTSFSIVVLLAGCAADKGNPARETRELSGETSGATDRARKPTPMRKMRQELRAAQSQVDDLQAAIDRVTSASTTALTPADEAFNRQVSQVIVQAAAARRRATEMQQQSLLYMDTWEKETERRHAVEKDYDRLRDAARATADAYQPLVTYLASIQKALASDLTPAGVNAAQPAFESARSAAIDLRQQTANFIDQIDLVLPVSASK
jgi:chromosome segregation ATPase